MFVVSTYWKGSRVDSKTLATMVLTTMNLVSLDGGRLCVSNAIVTQAASDHGVAKSLAEGNTWQPSWDSEYIRW